MSGGSCHLEEKAKDMQKYFHQLTEPDMQTPLGKEPYGSGSSDVCLPIPDRKYVTEFV